MMMKPQTINLKGANGCDGLTGKTLQERLNRRAARIGGATALVLLLLQGCGPSEPTMLAAARGYLDKGDRNAAVIQLKTLLQKNPQLGEARLLMGRALLESGNGAGAIQELEKALERGMPQAEVVPLMAMAMLSQAQFDKVLERFESATIGQPSADSTLRAHVAAAQFAKGRKEAALKSLDEALKLDANGAKARLLQAQLAASDGRADEALALARAMITQSIELPDAHTLVGTLVLSKDRSADGLAAARKSFESALAVKADHARAHMALIALASQEPEPEAKMRQQWEAFKKVSPNHPTVLLMEADYGLRESNLERARTISQQLIKGLPDDARVQLLAARVAERSGNMAQADSHTARALQLAPNWADPRRMLAQAQARNGQVKRALETLQPLLDRNPPDAAALALAGQALLQDGQPAKAEPLLRKAAQLMPDDARVKTLNAISQLGRGNDAVVLAELESIASEDKGTTADFALLSLRMRTQEFDAALKSVDAIKRKQPQNPQPLQIEAQVHLLKRNDDAARKSLQQALAVKSDYLPAAMGLARMDFAAGKEDDARGHLERVIKANPKIADAHLALLELRTRKGADAPEIRAQLEAAVKTVPEAPSLRLALINHLLAGTQDARAALTVAQDAAALFADQPDVLDALGRAQIANGNKELASATFRRMAALQPQNLALQLRLAESQFATAEYEESVRTLRKVLEIKKDHLPAQQAMVANLLTLRRQGEADAVIKAVQQQRPKESVGWLLEGDAAMAAGRAGDAVAAFRTALTKSADTLASIKLHAALVSAGRQAEAKELATAWERVANADPAFMGYLVDQALAQQKWAEAEARLRNLLKTNPDNAAMLNNLAYTLTMQGKPGALELAERANKLRPATPLLMDTLAMALAADKQYGKALDLQRQAVAKSFDDPTLKLGLARIYLASGDKTAARKELEKLAEQGKRFSQYAEVERLLKSL